MPAPTTSGPFIGDNQTIFQIAERKSRFGHRSWLVFKRRDGQFEARPYAADAIKAALLAGGGRTRFWWYDGSGISNICRSWSYGVHLWRCARGAERFPEAA
jgi:hypothetical protein